MYRKVFDYKAMQNDYDNGLSWREVITKYNTSWATITKSIKNNLLITRSKTEALNLSHKKFPNRKHSEETKAKISKIRKDYLTLNPDKVPYKLNHYSKKTSYAELYFIECFAKENINLKHHLQISLYQLDFYNEEKKICYEIDGEQHYVDKRISDSDIRRTQYLESLGWKVYRIRWSEFQRLCYNDKQKIIQSIKEITN